MNSLDFHSKEPLILVVDDEKTLRLVLRRAMEKEGYRVIEAADGNQCLSLCAEWVSNPETGRLPDIILLDAMMPYLDGFTCCAELHKQLGQRCPPVLIVTVLNSEESVNRAFAVGATDYITKPIHWAVLRQRVRRLLQTTWAMAELNYKIQQERLLKEKLEIANQKLEQLASLDGLTQLSNRRCFDRYLEREWLRLVREQEPLSLILCDIDFFKAYNDTYGHMAGDECLQQVAAVLVQTVRRPADLVARYGGEEFVVVLPNTPLSGAIQIAESVRTELKAKQIAHTGSIISRYVSLSCGVACLTPDLSTSPAQLLKIADQALYQAKLAGRDCTIADSPSAPSQEFLSSQGSEVWP